MTHDVSRVARALIALASIFVPRHRHDEWNETWESELAHIPPGRGRNRAAVRFAAGALAHALWELKEALTMRQLGHDVRFALRFLRRSPGFTAVAVLTLALGVGANATVFGLVNGLLLRPPAGIGDAERLVQVGRNREPARFDNWSWPAYEAMRDGLADAFDGVAGYVETGAVIGRDLEVSPATAHLVSANYFDVLRVRLSAGRSFGPADDQPGAAPQPLVVISHHLARQRFGGDRGAVGRTITVNGREFTIIGVAPPGFAGADVFRAPAELFVPMGQQSLLRGRGDAILRDWRSSWVWVVARLAPGATAAQARAATVALLRRHGDANEELRTIELQVLPGVGVRPAERAQGRTVSTALLALSGLVLLVACANLAGLALARGSARVSEFGVRMSLGATRWRLARASVVESAILGMAGALIALGVATMVAPHLHSVLPPVAVGFEPDWRVLAFSLAVGLAAGVAFAFLPTVSATRQDPAIAIRGAGRGVTGPGTRLRSVLVAAQLAVAFVGTTAALLLVRSMRNVSEAQPGFDPRGVITVSLDARLARAADSTVVGARYAAVLERVRALPGVAAAGYVAALPIVEPQSNQTTAAPGEPVTPGRPMRRIFINTADSGYFATLGIPLQHGRHFHPADGAPGVDVAIIDTKAAGEHFPGVDPVGRALPFQVRGRRLTVIGVVAAHRTRGVADPEVPQIFLPIPSEGSQGITLVVRTTAPPPALLRAIGNVLAESGTGLTVRRAAPLVALISSSAATTQTAARFAGIFGALSLLLSALGLYGVLAYSVARRQRELGIRLALGAPGTRVMGAVFGQTARIVAGGFACGAALSVAALGALRSLLFGVEPLDPATFATTTLVLALVAVLASIVPARRAATANAAVVLRDS